MGSVWLLLLLSAYTRPIIAELWAMYGYYFLFMPIQTHIPSTFVQAAHVPMETIIRKSEYSK